MLCNHPGQPIMTYVEFFRERQQARYAVSKGRLESTLAGQSPVFIATMTITAMIASVI